MAQKTAEPMFHAVDRIWDSTPHLEGSFPNSDHGAHPLKIWIFVANITNEFILGLDVLRAYNASVDLGCQRLCLAEEEVSLWSPGAGPWPSRLVVVKDQEIPAQCEGIVIAGLESPFGVENGLVEPSPQAHPLEGIYIARTLVQERREVPVKILNATHRDRKFTRASLLEHCEPVTLVNPPHLEQPQVRDSCSK